MFRRTEKTNVVSAPQVDLAAKVEILSAKVTALEAERALSEHYHTLALWTALDRVYDITLPDRSLSCIVCGHAAKRDGFKIFTSNCMFGGGKLERYKCPACECIFGPQKFLDQSDYMTGLDYKMLYSRYREMDTTDIEAEVFKSLSPSREKNYLNWGRTPWNKTIAKLRQEKWNVWGVDLTPQESPSGDLSGVDTLPGPLDGIFSHNVIEHLRNPAAQFRQFYEMLAPGGRMAHNTACLEYRHAYTRFTTAYLTGKSPEVLAEKTGFKIIDRIQNGEHTNIVFEKV